MISIVTLRMLKSDVPTNIIALVQCEGYFSGVAKQVLSELISTKN